MYENPKIVLRFFENRAHDALVTFTVNTMTYLNVTYIICRWILIALILLLTCVIDVSDFLILLILYSVHRSSIHRFDFLHILLDTRS